MSYSRLFLHSDGSEVLSGCANLSVVPQVERTGQSRDGSVPGVEERPLNHFVELGVELSVHDELYRDGADGNRVPGQHLAGKLGLLALLDASTEEDGHCPHQLVRVAQGVQDVHDELGVCTIAAKQ